MAAENQRRGSGVRVLDAEGMERTLARMAAEILERDGDGVMLVGIQTRGAPLARRLAELIRKETGTSVPVGTVDITLYRDDVGPWRPAHQQPVLKRTALPEPVDGRIIYLVDDVLYTGRTVRAALDALMDYGRPRAIRLAVLIDRGHRELPVAADIVGKTVPTGTDEDIQVLVREVDGEDGVWIGKEAPHAG